MHESLHQANSWHEPRSALFSEHGASGGYMQAQKRTTVCEVPKILSGGTLLPIERGKNIPTLLCPIFRSIPLKDKVTKLSKDCLKLRRIHRPTLRAVFTTLLR